jgi:hypothetical protein
VTPPLRFVNRSIGDEKATADTAEQAALRGMVLDDLSARMQVFGRQSVAKGWLEYQWCLPTAPGLRAELAEILVAKAELRAAEAAARDALFLARTEAERYARLSEILAMKGYDEQAGSRAGGGDLAGSTGHAAADAARLADDPPQQQLGIARQSAELASECKRPYR